MRLLKRSTALLLSGVMTASLAACGGTNTSEEADKKIMTKS